jgi:hypothetical protein
MIWTAAWAFATGLPVGTLAGWVLLGTPHSPARLLYCALGFGILWALLISSVAHYREGDSNRSAHVAIAGSSALVGFPGLFAAVAQLSTEWALLSTVFAVMGVGALYGARTRARPGSWLRQVVFAIGFLSIGGLVVFGTAAAVAASRVVAPITNEQRAAGIYDIDAHVVNRPLPACGSDPSKIEVLLDRGARPRLDRAGRYLWFDAEVEGARQIHRLDLESRDVRCWTCGEAGNNLRPIVVNGLNAVVFETDRHATLWEPFNTELHAIATRSGVPSPSRRLTRNTGADDHAIAGPQSSRIVWSRLEDGRYSIVSARIRGRTDGLSFGPMTTLEAGGSAWLAPAAWSPNARALVIVEGNPFRPLAAHAIDFATGSIIDMAGDLASAGAVAFNRDGGWMVTAREGERAARAPFGWMPPGAGFVLAAHARAVERAGPLLRISDPRVRLSELGSLGVDLSLGANGNWGSVTGLAATGDGTQVILGQQRLADALDERLLSLTLDCGS